MSPTDALIGGTGFVGGHLLRQHGFAHQFNSRTIAETAGVDFDTVVCAAAPGSMFEANRFPDRDRSRMDSLIDSLSRVRARQFVLISSIAVLADFAGQDDEGTTAFQAELAYGRNRRALEAFCANRFEDCLIVRLPALFGSGLRKNFLFDVLNPMPSMIPEARLAELVDRFPAELRGDLPRLYRLDPAIGMAVLDRAALDGLPWRGDHDAAVTTLGLSAVQFTNPGTRFQYYDMTRLWADIGLARAAGLDVIHLAPEPVLAGDVFARLTGAPMPATGARLHREDMRTRHADLWGRNGPYIASAADVMDGLARFYASATRRDLGSDAT